MIKTAIFSAIAVAASAKAACKNDHLSWKTSWGACPTYAKGKANYNWCKWDKSGGLYAKEVCPQCGTCASAKKVKKTAFPTRFPTAFPTALVCNSKTYNSVWGKCATYTFGKPNHNYCKSDFSKHLKSCTADKACKECVKPSFGMCKANPAQKWNAGWGLCATYAKGKANNFWCDKDQKDGVYAHEACAECNLCTAETDAKSCKDWNCAQWCKYYDSKFDAIYAEAGCNDDGEECKCDEPKPLPIAPVSTKCECRQCGSAVAFPYGGGNCGVASATCSATVGGAGCYSSASSGCDCKSLTTL
jgi:hypothetical protein